jgi:hypothetical protein
MTGESLTPEARAAVDRLLDVPDTTYNGWRNYPTWAVHLWLTNEPGSYEESTALVRFHRDRGGLKIDGDDALREYVRDLVERDEASLAADLLGYALDQVDWRQVADALASDD